jgi:hypothetical protein
MDKFKHKFWQKMGLATFRAIFSKKFLVTLLQLSFITTGHWVLGTGKYGAEHLCADRQIGR